jgi:hypothetical protein
VWSEDVLFTRKKACRPEAISRYLACCSSLVCIAEFFAKLKDGDDSPWVRTELFFNFLAVECCQGPHASFIQEFHFVAGVKWEANDVNMIISSKNNDLQLSFV